MCDTCGCNITSANEHLIRAHGPLATTREGNGAVSVLEDLLSANNHQAAHNRAHFDQHSVLAVNLMSSPGAGKTALLESTIAALAGELTIGVIEGDLETETDAERIRAHGVEAIQVTTGSACHLDAHMVHQALHEMQLDDVDILFIENVGNLVCPASFDLGQHRNVVLLSVPEGDDKPAKYPVMFRAADRVLITKCDVLPVFDDFLPARAESHVRALATDAPVHPVSARSGEGIDVWLAWLRGEIASIHASRQAKGNLGQGRRHRHHHGRQRAG